jgi:predicted ArsR family transcriptional regulator
VGAEALAASVAGLGFAPEEVTSESDRRDGQMDLRLRACPFKDAVLAEGGHLICALHRGLVRGALERIDDEAELAIFEPKHPVTAGCRVLVTGLEPR